MPATWRTLRVYVSATARDMRAERDHLVKVVFPELRERLLPYRVELIDVDPRRGLPEDEPGSERVAPLCLSLIDECDLFLGMIGSRYGWAPPKLPVGAHDSKPHLHDYEGASVTELEMRHAARGGGKPSLLLLRDEGPLADVPEPTRSGVYAESGEEGRGKVAAWRRWAKGAAATVRRYPCAWNSGRLVGLTEFGRLVGDWVMWAARALGLPQGPPPAAFPFEEASDLHERYLRRKRRFFVGRRALLRQLRSYADDDDTAPCWVTGSPGSGRSALLAEFVARHRARHPKDKVVPHFVAAGPRAAALDDLLDRLCRELGGVGDDPSAPTAERVRPFGGLLASVRPGRRVFLVIDDLDRLDAAGTPHTLHWLPERLPPHVKVVLSSPSGDATPSELRLALSR